MRLNLNRQSMLTYAKNFLLVLLGTAVLAFGTAVFIVPFDLVTGGVSGLAIILEKVIPLEFSVDFYITALTWILFFVGLVFLGRGFAMKTLLSTIFYPPLFGLFHALVNPAVLGGIFVLASSDYHDIAVLLATVFGGACVGAGCALTFLSGGSTGGMDVVSLLLCKLFKRLKSSYSVFAVDAVIVIMGIFIIDDIVLSLLGITGAFVCAVVVDRLFLGSSQGYVAQIVSEKSEEISRDVIERLDRTTTVLDAVGAYSGKAKKLIIISFSMREYSELMKIINEHDPYAFLTISRAHEITGEGWTHEKT